MDTKVKKMSKNFNALDKKMDRKLKKPFYSIISVLSGIILGIIILAIMGSNVGSFMSLLFRGSFGSTVFIGNLLANLTWVSLAGLAFGIAYKVKQFNIGLVAQMLFGAIFAYWFGFYVNTGPGGFLIVILIGALVGSAVALLIGILKTKLRVNEVISSIMLNWIALRFLQWFTNRAVWNPGTNPNTHMTDNDSFTKPLTGNNSINAGLENSNFGTFNWMFIFLIVALIVFGLIYKFTTWGQKTKILSNSPKVATVTGISSDKVILQSYALSGLIAGMAGVALHLGAQKGLLPQDAQVVPTKGFQGIAVSLIAFNNPFAIGFVGLFFGMLETSEQAIGTIMPVQSIQIITAIIIIVSSAMAFFINIDWNHKMILFREKRQVKLHKKYGDNIPNLSLRIKDVINNIKNKVNSSKKGERK